MADLGSQKEAPHFSQSLHSHGMALANLCLADVRGGSRYPKVDRITNRQSLETTSATCSHDAKRGGLPRAGDEQMHANTGPWLIAGGWVVRPAERL